MGSSLLVINWTDERDGACEEESDEKYVLTCFTFAQDGIAT